MTFSIIVATDNKGGIGLCEDGISKTTYSIPWKNSTDMMFFKEITSSSIITKSVIMGRNTYFSLPVKILPNRKNIVITSHHDMITEKDVECFNTLNDALIYCEINNISENYVIGGARLYEEALKDSRLETIYWNIISNTAKECNIFFPIEIEEAKNIFYMDTNYDLDSVKFHKFINKSKNVYETKYLNLLEEILKSGNEHKTRNAITKSLFAEQLVFDLQDQIPILTTKRMFIRGIFEELLWFLRGQTDSKILEDNKVNIWKGNTTKEFIDSVGLPYREGDIGNMYGFQLKHAGTEYTGCDTTYDNQGFDQVQYCLNLLKHDKYSRRIVMTTYVPHEAGKGVLYPCHGIVIQFYVREYDGLNYLSCHMYQRYDLEYLSPSLIRLV
jgi:dihydrofolate reductase/thymidylate synthase